MAGVVHRAELLAEAVEALEGRGGVGQRHEVEPFRRTARPTQAGTPRHCQARVVVYVHPESRDGERGEGDVVARPHEVVRLEVKLPHRHLAPPPSNLAEVEDDALRQRVLGEEHPVQRQGVAVRVHVDVIERLHRGAQERVPIDHPMPRVGLPEPDRLLRHRHESSSWPRLPNQICAVPNTPPASVRDAQLPLEPVPLNTKPADALIERREVGHQLAAVRLDHRASDPQRDHKHQYRQKQQLQITPVLWRVRQTQLSLHCSHHLLHLLLSLLRQLVVQLLQAIHLFAQAVPHLPAPAARPSALVCGATAHIERGPASGPPALSRWRFIARC
mmetsp:Transcript_7349/g.24385  ORF Transcript_7349/g.24385 Transcript_7349/m.24385 type:complete len:331 (+) Transcript_7349:1966-2958(+)